MTDTHDPDSGQLTCLTLFLALGSRIEPWTIQYVVLGQLSIIVGKDSIVFLLYFTLHHEQKLIHCAKAKRWKENIETF